MVRQVLGKGGWAVGTVLGAKDVSLLREERADLRAARMARVAFCFTEVNGGCGTHVHISPGKGLMWAVTDITFSYDFGGVLEGYPPVEA